jgi:hypothetical protein
MTRWANEEMLGKRLSDDESALVAVVMAASRKTGRGIDAHSLVAYEPRLFPNGSVALSQLERLEKEGVLIRQRVSRGAVSDRDVWVADTLARRALPFCFGALGRFVRTS